MLLCTLPNAIDNRRMHTYRAGSHKEHLLSSTPEGLMHLVAHLGMKDWGAGVPSRGGIRLDVFLGHISCLEWNIV